MREAAREMEIEKPGAWWHWRQEKSILMKEDMVTTVMQLGYEANCGQKSGHWMWWWGSDWWCWKEQNQQSGGNRTAEDLGWRQMQGQSKVLYAKEIYFGIPFLTINLQTHRTHCNCLLACLFPPGGCGLHGVGTVSFTVFSTCHLSQWLEHRKRLSGDYLE